MSALLVVLSAAQLYLLFSGVRCLRAIAEDSERRAELADMIRKFGKMFAEATAEPEKKRVVTFEAKEEKK